MSSRLRQLLWSSSIAVVACVVIVAGPWWCYHRYWQEFYGLERLSFSQEAWAAAADAETRGRMVFDLLAKNKLEGRKCAEVLAFLGPPDEVLRSPEANSDYEVRYRYHVGYLGRNPRAAGAFPFTLNVVDRGRDIVEMVYNGP